MSELQVFTFGMAVPNLKLVGHSQDEHQAPQAPAEPLATEQPEPIEGAGVPDEEEKVDPPMPVVITPTEKELQHSKAVQAAESPDADSAAPSAQAKPPRRRQENSEQRKTP